MLEQIVTALFAVKVQITKYEPIKVEVKGQTTSGISRTLKGYVSGYSANLGSCLGCPPHYDSKGQVYFVTASGDRLDNNKYTIACTNYFKLGTRVSLVNLTNSKSVAAVCNDRGGFHTPKYNNRIADLLPLVMEAIGAKTDIDLVEISTIE